MSDCTVLYAPGWCASECLSVWVGRKCLVVEIMLRSRSGGDGALPGEA